MPAEYLKAHFVAQRARGTYVATMSQPEASFALSQTAQATQPTTDDVKSLNKCLAWQISNKKNGIKFVKLDIKSIKVVVFTDSAFAKNTDYLSQICFVIVLADDKNHANLVH